MSRLAHVGGPDSFTTFGELLHYLRRRARLKQRDLAIASGYSEAQISRLEQNQRLPDPITLSALIIPALDLDGEPELAARLLALAAAARTKTGPEKTSPQPVSATTVEPQPLTLSGIPVAVPGEITRANDMTRLLSSLNLNRHIGLCGMSGIGKTTLAAAMARNYAHHAPVFWLTLHSQTTTQIDALVVQLAQWLQAHEQPEGALLLTPGNDGAPLPLERRFNLICTALNRMAAAGPPLFCLDNFYLVQYLSPVMHLLNSLMDSTATALLLISRETVPITRVSSLVLRGMDVSESTTLTARLNTGIAPISTHFAARLHAKVAGNPMLLRLALGQLFDHRVDPETFITRLETRPQISAYVAETVQRRLRLEAWHLCGLLAVIREPVNLYNELLLELCADEGDFGVPTAAVAELQRHLLIDDPASATLPPLVRDHLTVVLGSDPTLRRRLHHLAARWATQVQRDPLQAIYHYLRADALAEAAAILHVQIDTIHVQGQALAAVKLVDELLMRARRSGATGQQISRLLLSRAELTAHTLRTGEAEADYRAALSVADAPALKALAGIRLAQYLAQRGKPQQALRECTAARVHLSPGDLPLHLELAASEAGAYSSLSQYDAVLRVAGDALAQVEGNVAARQRATLHAQIGYALFTRRCIGEAQEQIRRAITIAEQEGWQRAAERYRAMLNHVLLSGGDLLDALRILDSTIPAVRTSGDMANLEYVLSLQALGHYLRGDLTATGAGLDAALALRHTLGMFLSPSTAEGYGILMLIGLNRISEARELFNHLCEHLPTTGSQRETGYNLCRRAMLELLAGQSISAQQTLRSVLELPATYEDSRLCADTETILAVALLVGGLPLRAARLVAADPPADAGVWALLDRLLVRAFVAAACDNLPAATTIMSTVRARALTSGHLRYQVIADRLLQAIQSPIDPPAIPRMLWIQAI